MDYSLNKSRKILEWSYQWYKSKGRTLPESEYKTFETLLSSLDAAYLKGDKAEASRLAHEVEQFTNAHFKKGVFQYTTEVITAMLVALAIAAVVRASWFEPMEIPTGSMRPTFLEQDHLTVSKTQFGINVPLETAHFIFEPDQIKRTGVVIWSGDGVALRETDTKYFGIFPYKKRYIKRLMGKPGDILYFYGGKVYGIDKDQKPIEEMVTSPYLEKLEYIPFMSFEGETTVPSRGIVQFEQMHQPIGRLRMDKGELAGEVFNGLDWIQDQPAALKSAHDKVKTYSDLWGIGNFAMARLLTPAELKQYPELETKDLEEGVLYLELIHHPSPTYPKPLLARGVLNGQAMLNSQHSVIPVQEKQLKAILDNIYTARFVVQDGSARRYSATEMPYAPYTSPSFPGVPNGTYEFYYGKGVKVGWGGITKGLPEDHPLYKLSPANVQNLYNLGIDLNTYYQPVPGNTFLFPHRYAYFRDGDLYLLGAPIYKKDDPLLQSFLKRELKKEKQSSDSRPYIAFKDNGPPLKEGKIDVEFIKNFGLEVAPKSYLVLGDNHAMSADSRFFGFLPEENLQGVPSFLIWPPDSRWGFFKKPAYPTFTLPRLIVWGIAGLIALIWYLWQHRRLRKPVFHRL